MKHISVQELRELVSRPYVALIDVRETVEYNLAHIGGATSVPRRLLEFAFTLLVPWRGTPIVVCDDDGRRAALAAMTMQSMGYTDVSVLSGGLNRWVTEGGATEWGVNVPSKDFGEKVLLDKNMRPDHTLLTPREAGGRRKSDYPRLPDAGGAPAGHHSRQPLDARWRVGPARGRVGR